MARDDGEEVVALEGVEPGGGVRPDGRGARRVAKKRDLAEEVARAGADPPRAHLDRQLAVADDVEAVAGLAGADDDLSRRDVDLEQMGGDSLLGDERERGEDRDALDQR